MGDAELEEPNGVLKAAQRAGRGGTLLRGSGAVLLRALAAGERTVTELVTATGLSQSNASNHLARLHERGLVTRERQGREVRYRLASPGLAHFLAASGDGGAHRSISAEEIADRFLDAVLTLRDEEPARVVDQALVEGLRWKELYLQVFVPTLNRVGELWEAGDLSVASEHLITAIILRLLHRLSLTLPAAPVTNAPSALVGCVEGELHTVGGRMVADFLIADGWRVGYLNGLLPLEYLLDAVRRHLPDAVVLCISTREQGASLRTSVERLLRWRGEQPLPLLVAGGRFFYTEGPVAGLDLCGTDIERVAGEMSERVARVRSARG